MAPFKMTQDYIDILGGFESSKYQEFRELLKRCFWDVRRQADRIVMIVELMQKGAFPAGTLALMNKSAPESRLPCFTIGEQTAQQLKERFQLGLTKKQCDEFVDKLLDSSSLSSFTRLYDAFQTFSQGCANVALPSHC
jgi:phosphatidylinositol kinase/protein kinase (PI-3  family)